MRTEAAASYAETAALYCKYLVFASWIRKRGISHQQKKTKNFSTIQEEAHIFETRMFETAFGSKVTAV